MCFLRFLIRPTYGFLLSNVHVTGSGRALGHVSSCCLSYQMIMHCGAHADIVDIVTVSDLSTSEACT